MKPLLLETIATVTAIVFTPIAFIRASGRIVSSIGRRYDRSESWAKPTAVLSACSGSVTAPSASCPYCPSSHRAQFGFNNRLTHGLILMRALAMAVRGENYNALGCGSNHKSGRIDQKRRFVHRRTNPLFDGNPFSHADFAAFGVAVWEADLLLTLSPSSSDVVLALSKDLRKYGL